MANLGAEIKRAVAHAKSKVDPETPVAILFGEIALSYRFNIRHDVVLKHIYSIKDSLPEDRFVAVGFSAFVREGIMLSNMGYLFSRDGRILCQPKRSNPDGDSSNIESFSENIYSRFHKNNPHAPSPSSIEPLKVDNGRSLSNSGEKYLAISTPTGFEIEYRVCADIWKLPDIVQNRLLLVSAWGLDYGYQCDFAKCHAIFINDSIYGPMLYINNKKRYFPTNFVTPSKTSYGISVMTLHGEMPSPPIYSADESLL